MGAAQSSDTPLTKEQVKENRIKRKSELLSQLPEIESKLRVHCDNIKESFVSQQEEEYGKTQWKVDYTLCRVENDEDLDDLCPKEFSTLVNKLLFAVQNEVGEEYEVSILQTKGYKITLLFKIHLVESFSSSSSSTST